MKKSDLTYVILATTFLLLNGCRKTVSHIYPVPQGDKWSFIDSAGKELGYGPFEWVKPITQHRFAIVVTACQYDQDDLVDAKFGLIDANGGLVLDTTFSFIRPLEDDRFVLVSNGGVRHPHFTGNLGGYEDGEWGLYDLQTSSIIMPCIYSFIDEPADSIIRFQKNIFEWGVFDLRKKTELEIKYQHLGGFSYGMAVATFKLKYGLIDAKGRWIIEPKYDFLDLNDEGNLVFRLGTEKGIMDTSCHIKRLANKEGYADSSMIWYSGGASHYEATGISNGLLYEGKPVEGLKWIPKRVDGVRGWAMSIDRYKAFQKAKLLVEKFGPKYVVHDVFDEIILFEADSVCGACNWKGEKLIEKPGSPRLGSRVMEHGFRSSMVSSPGNLIEDDRDVRSIKMKYDHWIKFGEDWYSLVDGKIIEIGHDSVVIVKPDHILLCNPKGSKIISRSGGSVQIHGMVLNAFSFSDGMILVQSNSDSAYYFNSSMRKIWGGPFGKSVKLFRDRQADPSDYAKQQ